jgi:hypothetical protein
MSMVQGQKAYSDAGLWTWAPPKRWIEFCNRLEVPKAGKKKTQIGVQVNLNPRQSAALELLQKELQNLERTVGHLYHVTLSDPNDAAWAHMRQLVSCLDSIAEVMRQALDTVKGDV